MASYAGQHKNLRDGRGGRTDHPPVEPGESNEKAVQEPAPSAQPSSFGPATPATAGGVVRTGATMATFAETVLAKYETLPRSSGDTPLNYKRRRRMMAA